MIAKGSLTTGSSGIYFLVLREPCRKCKQNIARHDPVDPNHSIHPTPRILMTASSSPHHKFYKFFLSFLRFAFRCTFSHTKIIRSGKHDIANATNQSSKKIHQSSPRLRFPTSNQTKVAEGALKKTSSNRVVHPSKRIQHIVPTSSVEINLSAFPSFFGQLLDETTYIAVTLISFVRPLIVAV
eukprot:scaffold2804_cov181-Amphora_coffeaeformis.AAC.35